MPKAPPPAIPTPMPPTMADASVGTAKRNQQKMAGDEFGSTILTPLTGLPGANVASKNLLGQ